MKSKLIIGFLVIAVGIGLLLSKAKEKTRKSTAATTRATEANVGPSTEPEPSRPVSQAPEVSAESDRVAPPEAFAPPIPKFSEEGLSPEQVEQVRKHEILKKNLSKQHDDLLRSLAEQRKRNESRPEIAGSKDKKHPEPIRPDPATERESAKLKGLATARDREIREEWKKREAEMAKNSGPSNGGPPPPQKFIPPPVPRLPEPSPIPVPRFSPGNRN